MVGEMLVLHAPSPSKEKVQNQKLILLSLAARGQGVASTPLDLSCMKMTWVLMLP